MFLVKRRKIWTEIITLRRKRNEEWKNWLKNKINNFQVKMKNSVFLFFSFIFSSSREEKIYLFGDFFSRFMILNNDSNMRASKGTKINRWFNIWAFYFLSNTNRTNEIFFFLYIIDFNSPFSNDLGDLIEFTFKKKREIFFFGFFRWKRKTKIFS